MRRSLRHGSRRRRDGEQRRAVAALGAGVERPQEVVERARNRPGSQGLRLVPPGRPLLFRSRAQEVRR